jgi:methionine synthase II (cobalamin-independent)
MCIVNNIVVDELELREMLPELNSNAAIRLWVQKLVDVHVQELKNKYMHQQDSTSCHDLIPDDVCRTVWQEVEEEYKDADYDDADDAIDLETFRADLHKMIEEVYAEP